MGLARRIIPVSVGRGDQHAPGGPLSLFGSAAILLHLAERTGRFAPRTPVAGQR